MLSRVDWMSVSDWVSHVSRLLRRLVGLGDKRRLKRWLKSLRHQSRVLWLESGAGNDVAIQTVDLAVKSADDVHRTDTTVNTLSRHIVDCGSEVSHQFRIGESDRTVIGGQNEGVVVSTVTSVKLAVARQAELQITYAAGAALCFKDGAAPVRPPVMLAIGAAESFEAPAATSSMSTSSDCESSSSSSTSS